MSSGKDGAPLMILDDMQEDKLTERDLPVDSADVERKYAGYVRHKRLVIVVLGIVVFALAVASPSL